MKRFIVFALLATVLLSSCYRDIYSENIDGYIKGTIKKTLKDGRVLDEAFSMKLYSEIISGCIGKGRPGEEQFVFRRSDKDGNEITFFILRTKDTKEITDPLIIISYSKIFEKENEVFILNTYLTKDFGLEITNFEYNSEKNRLTGDFKASPKVGLSDLFIEGTFFVDVYQCSE